MEEMLKKTNIYHFEINMPHNWSKDMIIRNLYVRLAPHFRRDLKYFLASKEEQLKQYKQGFVFTGPEVNCKSICIFYCQLFHYLGIECQIITTNTKAVPHHALIVKGSNGWYHIDPLKDLLCNQLGLKTSFFAHNPDPTNTTVTHDYPFLIQLPDDEIRSLDRTTGLVIDDYRDSFFEKIHRKCTDNNQFAKEFDLQKTDTLSMIFGKIFFAEQQLINLGNIPGTYERKQYYEYLRLQLFNKRELGYINILFDTLNDKHCVTIDITSPTNQNENYLFTECYEQGKGYSLKQRRSIRIN